MQVAGAPPSSQTQGCSKQGAAFCPNSLIFPCETKNALTGYRPADKGYRACLWGPVGYSSQVREEKKEDRATCPSTLLSQLPEVPPKSTTCRAASGTFPAAATRWALGLGGPPLLARPQLPMDPQRECCPPKENRATGVDRKPNRHRGRAARQRPVSPAPAPPLQGPGASTAQGKLRHLEPGSGCAPHHWLGTGLWWLATRQPAGRGHRKEPLAAAAHWAGRCTAPPPLSLSAQDCP